MFPSVETHELLVTFELSRIFSHVFLGIAVALFENLLPTLSYYLGSNGWSCAAKHPYFVVLP